MKENRGQLLDPGVISAPRRCVAVRSLLALVTLTALPFTVPFITPAGASGGGLGLDNDAEDPAPVTDICFPPDSYTIPAVYKTKLLNLMQKAEDLQLFSYVISGYTNENETAVPYLTLSRERAEAVANYLIQASKNKITQQNIRVVAKGVAKIRHDQKNHREDRYARAEAM